MKIKKLEISNILSIEKACIEFDDTGLVLVEGFNYDDNTANGAGKTAIMNALSFGLYGKFPRKVTVSSILRYGTKKGSVVVGDIQTNNGVWRVERCRPTAVIYSKDGEVQDITQAEFEAALGLSYSQFLISMYSAQTQGENFIDMNDTAKKEFLLKLMNLEEFALAKGLADQEMKRLDTKIRELQLNEATLASRIQAHGELVRDVDAINSQIAEIQQQVKQFQDKIAELGKIQRPDVLKYDEVAERIASKRLRIQTAQITRNQLAGQFQILAKEYQQWKNDSDETEGVSVDCPECGDEIRLIDGELISFGNLEKMEEAKATKAEKIKEQCHELKVKIDKEDVKIAQSKVVDELEIKVKKERLKKFAEYDAAQQTISEYRNFISQQQYKIQMFNNQLVEQAERQQELERTKNVLKTVQNDLNTNSKELELVRTVSHLYSPTGAQAYIMDSVIGAFNDSIANYVNMIWPNASYSIQAYKVNKTGEIKAKFSDKLILNGKEVSIGSLSGGQHRCLSLAIDFAMLDVLSDRFSIDINPVVFDEPLQGLDASNKERVLEVLEMIAADRNIIIIEHSSEFKSAFVKTVNVELRNGISTVST
jgi:DNA repair exonuclease SbcCD ATPase subunit